jgi:hypothetical protein
MHSLALLGEREVYMDFQVKESEVKGILDESSARGR